MRASIENASGNEGGSVFQQKGSSKKTKLYMYIGNMHIYIHITIYTLYILHLYTLLISVAFCIDILFMHEQSCNSFTFIVSRFCSTSTRYSSPNPGKTCGSVDWHKNTCTQQFHSNRVLHVA